MKYCGRLGHSSAASDGHRAGQCGPERSRDSFSSGTLVWLLPAVRASLGSALPALWALLEEVDVPFSPVLGQLELRDLLLDEVEEGWRADLVWQLAKRPDEFIGALLHVAAVDVRHVHAVGGLDLVDLLPI